jgi:hypothetical protein
LCVTADLIKGKNKSLRNSDEKHKEKIILTARPILNKLLSKNIDFNISVFTSLKEVFCFIIIYLKYSPVTFNYFILLLK